MSPTRARSSRQFAGARGDRDCAALVLAAGASRRMAGADKLLLPVGGEPLVRRTVRCLLQAGLGPVLAVVDRSREAQLRRALGGLPCRLVGNPEAAEGMAASIRWGVRALPADAPAVAVLPADLPRLQAATVGHLVERLAHGNHDIVAPRWQGRRGHPVVFRLPDYREALGGLCGDRGARSLLAAAGSALLEIDVDDPGVALDLDTPAQYRSLCEESGSSGEGER